MSCVLSLGYLHHCYIFGKLLVCWVVISFLSEPLLTTILTYNQEESVRYFSISFSSDEIITLFLAISIMLIHLDCQPGDILEYTNEE